MRGHLPGLSPQQVCGIKPNSQLLGCTLFFFFSPKGQYIYIKGHLKFEIGLSGKAHQEANIQVKTEKHAMKFSEGRLFQAEGTAYAEDMGESMPATGEEQQGDSVSAGVSEGASER